jgi:hypothetical protein
VIRERFGPDAGFGALDDRVAWQRDGVLIRRREETPSMIKMEGLWVHQGTPDCGAHWDRIIDDVRDERAQSVVMT